MKKSMLFIVGIVLGAFSVFILATTYVNVPAKGTIYRAFAEYYDTDTISITTGYGECNGRYFEITSEISHDMTSLATGEDFHYIYIDDSASDYPDPNIIDSTTEPSWSDTKMGWYNGDDRCIGVVWSTADTATLWSFVTNSELICWGDDIMKQALANGNPTENFDTLETTAYIPVNAVGVYVHAQNTDFDGVVEVNVSSYDGLRNWIVAGSYSGYASATGWIHLKKGSSRDLKWWGRNDDDNNFAVDIRGYRIER